MIGAEPLGVATPSGKDLATKQGGTFPNQGLQTPGRCSPAVDNVVGGMPCPHQPPNWGGLASKEGRLHEAATPGTFPNIIDLDDKNTPEQTRRPWKHQPTSTN
jgi:hypothetical protein